MYRPERIGQGKEKSTVLSGRSRCNEVEGYSQADDATSTERNVVVVLAGAKVTIEQKLVVWADKSDLFSWCESP